MNEQMKVILTSMAFLLVIVFLGSYSLSKLDLTEEIVKQVKSGDKTLYCLFSDGWREVPKEKVIDREAENGYWIFDNGYAKTCKVR
jgi:hypothetical protein